MPIIPKLTIGHFTTEYRTFTGGGDITSQLTGEQGVVIGESDWSGRFLSSHSEQTTNDAKDENKYDLILADIDLDLMGRFKPTDRVELDIINRRDTCQGPVDETIVLYRGEVQCCTADETTCEITGSCDQGGFVGYLPQSFTKKADSETITDAVKELLDQYYRGRAMPPIHIAPTSDVFQEYNNYNPARLGYNEAMQQLADEGSSVWYFDENGEFWFIEPYVNVDKAVDLTGCILEGQNASTMIGLCTVVNVQGGALAPPNDPSCVNPTHKCVTSQARLSDDMMESYGEIIAPTITVPMCDQATCDKIAANTLRWFLQFKDVPQVKISGKAPMVGSRVMYKPFNGILPASFCGGLPATLGYMTGRVTRRVVDIDTDNGFVCTLDVSTTFSETASNSDVYQTNVHVIEGVTLTGST